MPENDMGTAHGRVKITVDDRQLQLLATRMLAMQKVMETTNKRLDSLQKELSTVEKGTAKASKSFDRAAKSSKGFDRGLVKAAKSSKVLNYALDKTLDNLPKIVKSFDQAQGIYKPFEKLAKTLIIFNRAGGGLSGLAQGLGQVNREASLAASTVEKFTRNLEDHGKVLRTTRGLAIGAAAGMSVFWNQGILGKNDALRQMPRLTQELHRVTTGMRWIGIAGPIAASALAGPWAMAMAKAAMANSKFHVSVERALSRIDAISPSLSRATNGVRGLMLQYDRAGTVIGNRSRTIGRAFADLYRGAEGFPRAAQQVVTGIALMNAGIRGLTNRFAWLGRIPKRYMYPLIAAIGAAPAALELFGKALTGVSNILVGLLDGIKQLSGGFLALPGIIAGIVVGVTSLIGVFGGLKDQMKDLFSDDIGKVREAMAGLPAHLRPLGYALIDISDKWKEVKKSLQERFFVGIEDQLKGLSETWVPRLQSGMTQVVTAFRGAKDQIVGFLASAEAGRDINALYMNVAQTITNLSAAIRPTLDGFRDLGSVGSTFGREVSAWAGVIASRFADWAKTNRENGNLLKWMRDSVGGARDLVVGLTDVVKAMWGVLTVFKTNTGENALERFAKWADELNKKVQKSAATGWLREMADLVKDLGTDRIESLVKILKDFWKTAKTLAPVIQDIGTAFSEVFLPILRWALQDIRTFATILNNLGIDSVIGWILGLVAAFKLIPEVLGPVKNVIQTTWGAFLVFRNSDRIFRALDTALLSVGAALENFGPLGRRAGAALIDLEGGVKRVAAGFLKIAGATAFVAAAFAAAFLATESNADHIREGLKKVDDATINTRKHAEALRQAFIADNSFVGHTVMDEVKNGLNTMTMDLKSQGETAIGWWETFKDSFFGKGSTDGWGFGLSNTKEFNKLQKNTQDARRAIEGLKKLESQGINLSDVIASSDSNFKSFIENLRKSGENGNEAADALQRQRDVFAQMEQDFKRLGPGGAQLAEGIQKIAEAGGDATAKLEGLRTILIGLGILKTDSLDAAFAYAEGIRKLADEVADLSTKGIAFDNILAADGKSFNTNSEGAKALYDILRPLGEQFRANVAAGANANVEYQKFTDQLDALSTATGLTRDQLIQLGRDVGLAPKEVNFAVGLEGVDETTQGLAAALLRMQAQADKGVEIPVGVKDPKAVDKKLEEILGHDISDVQGNLLVIRPNVSQADLKKVQDVLAGMGIGTPGSPTPQAAVVNVAPNLVPPKGENVAPSGDPTGLEDLKRQMQGPIDDAVNAAKPAGEAFGQDFADGIASKKDEVAKAADDVAKEARDRLPGSPAKRGPLSGRGWSMYGGQAYSTDFATGITSRANLVGRASNAMAGQAAGALGGGAGIEAAGEYLGQLSRLVNFGARIAEVAGKMAETIFGFAKFISDPLGKGTFFGKNNGFRKSNISADDLRKRREDAAQARMFQFLSGGQRDTSMFDTQTGLMRIKGPGKLQADSSKSDIVAGIVAEGQRRNLTPEQIQAAIATAQIESNFNPIANGGIQPYGGPGSEADRALGLYQEKAHFGSEAERFDPNGAIQRFYDRYVPQLQGNTDPIVAAALAQNPQLGSAAAGSEYARTIRGAEKDAAAALNDALKNGATTPFQTGGAIPGLGLTNNLNPSILSDTGKTPSGLLSRQAALIVQQLWGDQIRGKIGGSRDNNTVKGTHDAGLSIDIPIGPDQMALGDEIRNFFMANADQFGIEYSIWRDLGINAGSGKQFNADPGSHQNHIDVKFKDGATATIGPNGTSLKLPYNSRGVVDDNVFGPPIEPGTTPTPPKRTMERQPDGTFKETTKHGQSQSTPGPINPFTGQPWTDAEAEQYFKDNPLQFDPTDLKPGDLDNAAITQKTQEELLAESKAQTPLLQQALDVQNNPNATDQEVLSSLSTIQAEIDRQTALDTPASRATAGQLEGMKSSIMSDFGFEEDQNPIDKVSTIAGNATSIAGDIFQVLDSSIQAVGATKNITDRLVRGMSNTEDIFSTIDDIQKFIDLAADIAGAVSSVTSAIASIVGAAGSGDPSGGTAGASAALGAVSQVAGLVQSALETVNAVIDLGQEAYRIIGSYVGDFLGFLTGGLGGKLEGNVKFLLDETSGVLRAYSQDNPLDKREHNLPGVERDDTARNQQIGQINVIGGYGSDPRDLTRQMMFQVHASEFAGVTGQ